MERPKAEDLIKIPPGEERDKYYEFPYTGPYEGEPQPYEILHWKEHQEIWGKNHLAIHKTCPACGSSNAEWIRQEWAVCFTCVLAFDAFELYIEPIPNGIQEVENGQTDCDMCLTLRGVEERTYGAPQSIVQPAKFAVREDETLLVVCTKCMEEFYGMHETVLLLSDTYVPRDDEGDNGGE